MAIRVLTRSLNCSLFSKFPQISPNRFKKIRIFSQTPYLPIKPSLEFEEKSQIRQQFSLSDLLQRYGFPSSHLHDFIVKNRFLLNFNLSDIEKSLGILLSFNLPPSLLVLTVFSCPRVLELGFLKKWEMGFAELGFCDVPPLLIQKVLEQSRVFRIEPDEFLRNLWVIKDMGFSDETVIKVLENVPDIVNLNLVELDRKIDFLKDIGVKINEIDRICRLFPGILMFSIKDQLNPLVDEFDELGFGRNEIRKAIVNDPRVLSMEVGELSRCLELLRTLKCRVPIKENILRRGAFRAGIEVKLRVDCLCRYGLIRREAFQVLQREPRTIIYDLEDIEKKIEYLLHRIGFDIGCLIEVPEYLGVNFEKQIIPRHNVIKYLRSRGGIGFEMGLKGLIKPSRLRFYNLYVKPYPECEKIFGGFSRNVELTKRRPPVGLWKLFKPQSYPESEEDVTNIRLFMESLLQYK